MLKQAKHPRIRPFFHSLVIWVGLIGALTFCPWLPAADRGALDLLVVEKSDNEPTTSRFELFKGAPKGKPMSVRRSVPAGFGIVLDRHMKLELPDGPYFFRFVRGPEYRIVTGNFLMESTSRDEKSVALPRMVDMLEEGWTSGDVCVVASRHSLKLRMASEDLHVAGVLGSSLENPIPNRESGDDLQGEPFWIRNDVSHQDGLLFVGLSPKDWLELENQSEMISSSRIAAINKLATTDRPIKVAIENPFAWQLPVWLASSRISGFTLFGDWLRLDRKISNPRDGRSPVGLGFDDGQRLGRWAEEIYRNILDAGFRIPLLAGGGDQSSNTPVGYNRLYVTVPSNVPRDGDLARSSPVADADQWWQHAWAGNSVATNGPMLRPRLAGRLPGHIFTARSGEALELHPELELAVRDQVEYLEVIHNNKVHYSARLDEFAKAGGRIPPIHAKESGWVMIRIVTLFEDHYRAAVSSPWYIEFDNAPRVSKRSVAFFQDWLGEHETKLRQLPANELKKHVPFIRAARKFWAEKETVAVD